MHMMNLFPGLDARQAAELRLSAFGGTTRVAAAVADLEWLGEFFIPALDLSGMDPIRETVRAAVDADRFAELRRAWKASAAREIECFTLDGRFETFPGGETSGGELLIALERFGLMLRVSAVKDEYELAAESERSKLRLGLMRVVREVATVRALRSGALPLHGAACALAGGAVGFLGRKTAGKSTALIHALQNPAAQFVTNDRFFVRGTGNGWSIHGMPTIIKIRSGTLELFHELRLRSAERPYHRERTLSEVDSRSGRPSLDSEGVSFSQAQFLRVVGRSAVSAAPLDALLFPERDDHFHAPEFASMSTDEAARRLRENLLSPGPRLRTAEAFDVDAPREIDDEAIEQLCREVAAASRCFRYRQGFRTLQQPFPLPGGLRAA